MHKVLIVVALVGSVMLAGPAQAATPFVDVPIGHLFETEIDWMADEAITQGCNPPANDRYCPDDVVTRGQMAAFLVRALGLVDAGGGDLFVDDDGSIFEGDIDRLGTAGVTAGCNPPANDRYCPDDVVTRGQMAAFLYRALASDGVEDPQVATTTLPDTTVGASYSVALMASGGTPPYTWSLDSGTLPAGIDLSTSGQLSGAALSPGDYSFAVTVEDAAGGSDTANLAVTVVGADLEITTSALPIAFLGEPYDFQMEAIGGQPPYQWAVVGLLPLPPDLVLSSDGAITGASQVGSGSGPIEFAVTDSDATTVTRTLTLTASLTAVEIDTSVPLPDATTGEEYEAEVSASGGARPVTFSVVSGDLPPGITMDAQGDFAGIPPSTGTFLFTVEAEDVIGTSATAELSITVNPGPMSVLALTRVSVETDGDEVEHEASNPVIAAGGRYVVFETASELVGVDNNAVTDVYRHDLQTRSTLLVSVGTSGSAGGGSDAAISETGRFVAFRSAGSGLVFGDTNGDYDIFVRDMQAGNTIRVSVDTAGGDANGDSFAPSISASGNKIAFYSHADDLVVGDSNGNQDVFVHTISTGATVLVSVDSTGGQLPGLSSAPVISGDGSTVGFSTASNAVPGDTNGQTDVYVVDLGTLAVELASADTTGIVGDATSLDPSLSNDGNVVAFHSYATNLVPGDTNGERDVFVRRRSTGEVFRASAPGAIQSVEMAQGAAMAGGGRFVVFYMDGDELDPLDDNGHRDIYMYDIFNDTIRRISVRPNGIQGNATAGRPSVSFLGDRVVFESDADNLVDDDSNAVQDIYGVQLVIGPALS